MTPLTKILLVFIVIGGLWQLGRLVFSEKTPREISRSTPFLLKCDECDAMFNYDKKKWTAREYPPNEWKNEYRNRNDCLKCDAKWSAKIIGQGKAKDYLESAKTKKPEKVRTVELPTINGQTDTFVVEPIPSAPINPKRR